MMTDNFVERQVQLDFYRKLLVKLEAIADAVTAHNEILDDMNESLNGNLQALNKTLQRFGAYMPEPSHPEIRAGVD